MSTICFPNLFVERPMQDDVGKLSAKQLSDFLKFNEKRAFGKHKSITTHSSKISARTEDPIITVCTRR